MRSISIVLVNICLLLFITFSAFPGDLDEDFSRSTVGIEPGDGDWVFYDEEDLGDVGPSSWQIGASPLDGDAMTQNSNIWGDATDAVAIGSFVIYDKAEWADFALEVDVLANDNDGMGLVWRWQDMLNHYRYITMIDSGNSPAGRRGPYRAMERRLGDAGGDELPFYEVLQENTDAYEQGVTQHWGLEAIGDTFKFYVDNKLTLEAQDSVYKSGKVGFLVYAQSGVFFDNLLITDLWAVDAKGKLAATWAKIKDQ
jgi:hypothetical protein